MMPVEFPEQTIVLGKPQNMTDEDCSSLSVFVGNDDKGKAVVISKWRLSKEDLEEINKTGELYLQITGHFHPPVSLYTKNPFTENANG